VAPNYRAASDADGLFKISSVAVGSYQIGAEKQGFAAIEPLPLLRFSEAVEDLQLLLYPGATIAGHVHGLDFDELSRLKIWAARSGAAKRQAEVDHRGDFALRDMPPGAWRLEGSLDGGRRHAQAQVRIDNGAQQVAVDIHFKEQLTLSGRVALGGSPLPGTEISLRRFEQSGARSSHSNHEGEFEVQDLAPGTYQLALSNAAEMVAHHETVELTASRFLEIDLETFELSGKILDSEKGRGIEGAVIRIEKRVSGSHSVAQALATGSAADGAFELLRIPPGTYHLRVEKDGFASLDEELTISPSTPPPPLEVSLQPTGGLGLRVRMAQGGVPPWVQLRVLDAGGGLYIERSLALDSAGEARLGTLPAGDWLLQLGARGASVSTVQTSVPGPPLEVSLGAGGRLQVLVPDLEASGLLARLEILGPQRQLLLALDRQGEITHGWRVEEGRVLVDGIPPGTWKIEVTAADGRAWFSSVTTQGDGEQWLEIL
jgi:hypothetical protein